MLSLQYIRENVDRVKRDVLLRNTTAPIDRILQLDEDRREILQQVEGLRAKRNTVSKAIGASKDSADREIRIAEMRLVGDEIDRLDGRLKKIETELQEKLYEVPNILDPNVPKGPDETSNKVVEVVGEIPQFPFAPRPHWELGEIVGGLDIERGAKMSGSRFYTLRGPLAKLQRALIQFMLNEHGRAGFTEAYLPYMLSEASLYAAGQLPKFRDNLYRDAEEDYFFIPTAEVAFVNLYRDEIIPPGQLPMRARSIPEVLGLPYRVIALCSGDIGFNSTKTFDLEIWAPGQGEWLEVSSASNCLEFQARRANIRYRSAQDEPTKHPHMLNASGLALPRTVIAVMENYQREDGSIEIPEALRPYMGMDVIPAV
jgi:seryl-tRNA synthetase